MCCILDLPWLGPVDDRAVSYRDHANGLNCIGEVVDDAEGADTERPQSREAAVQGMSRKRLTLEQPQGVLDGVDQRPVELEQLASVLSG